VQAVENFGDFNVTYMYVMPEIWFSGFLPCRPNDPNVEPFASNFETISSKSEISAFRDSNQLIRSS
tara:strand:- start:26620 stop:26817 length:198 start_codon:yes stop_codon:yes gene_type:complete